MAVLTASHTSGPSLRERHPVAAQIARYVIAGGVGTLVNALVYLALRTSMELLPANLTALVVSTLVSTEVNRRFTFSGEEVHPWRAHVQTVGMVAFYAVYSSLVLLALHTVVDSPTPLLESATVAAASVLGGAGRFLLLRFWVFEDDTDHDPGHDYPGHDSAGDGPDDPAWEAAHMGHSTVKRTVVAAAAGAALLLSAGAACGPVEGDDDDTPGVSNQQDGDDDDGGEDD
ncbi:GtrA family protein [Pseudonocardia sp. KRD-184]|uniref:GtrA family protein n=1 Tax=Pseudonocardia oceani TaxID=2792013 RepID=A0ABS6UCS3_9PSEU|nr:GtrA family protein [Pseudonocardia oceani]MBW0088583.1 GtrA family protein [Pseudonocardia oceani]MBW0094438.1 GtrA family protein [Pseudonocardia oceani]MBW0108157.1 GtrA family protein [Pseudonocardia oceani]MBW0119955.1 GtrA family protein [Pseudonocardia oceani]MBW0130035.1 GtrA family protein [Pseudonocardia oceani]